MDNNDERRFDRAKNRRVREDMAKTGSRRWPGGAWQCGPACMNTHLPVEELVAEDAQAPHIDV